MKWYAKDGSPVTQVEKKGGGFTAPSIVHARKLGLIPDADDVLAVYHGSHIAAERLTRALDIAGQFQRVAYQNQDEWRRAIMARVRDAEMNEHIENEEILGDVAGWCDQRTPSSVEGIAACEMIESFNPHKVELDVREHSWCSVRADFVMRGCDLDAMQHVGADAKDEYVFIASGNVDAARRSVLFAKAAVIEAAIDQEIDPEIASYMILHVKEGDVDAHRMGEVELEIGSDIAAAVRMLWQIEHDYIITEE